MNRFGRGISTLLCIILIPCMALGSSVQEMCESLLNRDGSWSADYSVSLSSWIPFGETRLKMLNDLLKHFSFHAKETEGISSVSILADGSDALELFIRKQGEDPGGFSFSFAPDVVYTGGSLSELVGATSLQSELLSLPIPEGLSISQLTWADAGFTAFSRLPEIFPEYTKSTDVKTKLNDVGLSVKKSVITLPKDEVAQNVMERLSALETDSSLQLFIDSLVFTGRQQIILYYDENGVLLRVRYSGQTGSEENQRKVTLDWRALRGTVFFDNLSLKAPAVKGGDRDVLTFLRKGNSVSEENCLEAEMEWTLVRGNIKTVLNGLADLSCSGENRLSGVSSLAVKTSGLEEKVLLYPDLQMGNGFGTEGDVRLQYLKSGEIQLDALLHLKISDNAEETTDYPVRYVDLGYQSAEEKEELKTQISQGIASALLQSMLRLPEEDLDFLKYELSDELWQRVLQTENPSIEGGHE